MIKKIGSILLEIILVLLIIGIVFAIATAIIKFNGQTTHEIAFIGTFEPKIREQNEVVDNRDSNVVLIIPEEEIKNTGVEEYSQNYYYSQLNVWKYQIV